MNPSSLKIELDVTIVIEDDRSACAIRLAVRSQSLPGYVNLGVRTLVVHSSIQIGRFFEYFLIFFALVRDVVFFSQYGISNMFDVDIMI